MKSVEFCYWLQGMFELANPKTLDENQTELIRRHLAMAFQHDIDKKVSPEDSQILNNLHHGNPPNMPVMRC